MWYIRRQEIACMEAIPLRTRQRIIERYAEGKKTREISSLFGLCKAATRRVKQHLRERGTLAPLPRNAGAKGKCILGFNDTGYIASEIDTRQRFGVKL